MADYTSVLFVLNLYAAYTIPHGVTPGLKRLLGIAETVLSIDLFKSE